VKVNKTLILFLSLLLSCYSSLVFAQKHNIGIKAGTRIGYLMPHRSTMAHLVDYHAYGFELGGVLQTNGKKQWHHDFNFPEVHLSAVYADLGNKEVLGSAFGLAGGIYLPFFKKNGWSLGSHLESGVAIVTKQYDVNNNPKNNAIGSHLNCLVSFGLQFEKQFIQQALAVEFSMTHLSNGAYRLPNLGLNLPFVGINYTRFFRPIKEVNENVEARIRQQSKSWEFFTQLVGSVKQIYPTGGSTYGVVSLTNYTHYKFSNKCIVEGGVDVIYNGSTVAYNGGGLGKEMNFQLGIYSAYVLPIHKFEMFVAMGRYIYKPLFPEGMWYHKLGGRFQIVEKLWANISIKSHWAKADYFEYGLIFKW